MFDNKDKKFAIHNMILRLSSLPRKNNMQNKKTKNMSAKIIIISKTKRRDDIE